MAPPLTLPFPHSLVEGSHWNEGLLLGRPPEEPEQPLTENSLLEVLDGAIMMYNLSVHQQLGKVVYCWSSTCVGACVGVCVPTRDPGLHVGMCHSKTDSCQCFLGHTWLTFGGGGCLGPEVGSLAGLVSRLGPEKCG